ncbi:uncharacterized protein LOC144631033 isoform X2 [Oculina patagonica]
MASYFILIIVILLSSTSARNLVHKSDEPRKDTSSKQNKVVDFTVHISEAGEEYNEKIEVDPDKQTELFEVPAHPGVDRSDTLHDFKHNLTMLRFPDSRICYIFPLMKKQSTPEKLMRDLKKAKQMVITETRRVVTTWIIDGEVTDRSVLSDELADFCAQYPIYHVREAQETLKVTGIQIEERANRVRRQTGNGLNGTALCPGGMDLNAAYQICPEPALDCETNMSCIKSPKCFPHQVPQIPYFVRMWRLGRRRRSSGSDVSCWNMHTTRLVTVCCKYICNNIGNSNNGTAEIFERL